MSTFARQLSFIFDSLRGLTPPQTPSISIKKDVKIIWDTLVLNHFPTRPDLYSYKILWSNRPQKRVLASCNIQKKIVRIAPAMNLPEAEPFLEALIYHELCHAVVGINIKNGRRDIHSKEFKRIETLHPEIKNLDMWIKTGGWIKAVRKSTRQINQLKRAKQVA